MLNIIMESSQAVRSYGQCFFIYLCVVNDDGSFSLVLISGVHVSPFSAFQRLPSATTLSQPLLFSPWLYSCVLLYHVTVCVQLLSFHHLISFTMQICIFIIAAWLFVNASQQACSTTDAHGIPSCAVCCPLYTPMKGIDVDHSICTDKRCPGRR